jgi:hypothetical protein
MYREASLVSSSCFLGLLLLKNTTGIVKASEQATAWLTALTNKRLRQYGSPSGTPAENNRSQF